MKEKLYTTIKIDNIWGGHPVKFDIIKHNGVFYIAYYNHDRNMVIASYAEKTKKLRKTILSETLGWDSHNGVNIGIDREGYIHLSGNMHKNRIIYFRGLKPYDISSFDRISKMTGNNENSCTYPVFFNNLDGILFFRYRNGKSGKGDLFINTYNENKQEWLPAIDQPLFDGENERNAYPSVFVLGPDNYFHVCWVWRDNSNCETNHTLEYAKTENFIDWFDANGNKLFIPFKVFGGDRIDPIKISGGLLNGSTKIGFDKKNTVIISYHKFDSNGNTQIYNARTENNSWKIYQTSNWNYRWDFSGGGTIELEIEVFPIEIDNDQLIQRFKHKKYGEGTWKLNESNMLIQNTSIVSKEFKIAEKNRIKHIIPNEINPRHYISWETFSANRDQKRDVFSTDNKKSKLYLSIQKIQ